LLRNQPAGFITPEMAGDPSDPQGNACDGKRKGTRGQFHQEIGFLFFTSRDNGQVENNKSQSTR